MIAPYFFAEETEDGWAVFHGSLAVQIAVWPNAKMAAEAAAARLNHVWRNPKTEGGAA